MRTGTRHFRGVGGIEAPLQVQFRLGTIPVRVSGTFLFLVLVLGAQLQRIDLIAIWTVIVFVSILVHELGHAVVGRHFGLVPEIDLHGMGGRTSWSNGREVGDWRSIGISLAGPLAGFMVAGVLLLARRFGLHPEGRAAVALELAVFINYKWGLFNLAPMLPLDGGNVLRSALNLVTKGRGEKPARIVSFVIGGAFVVYAFATREVWLGALALFFTSANIQAYRQGGTKHADPPLAEAIDKAYLALERHDGAQAIALLRPALVPQASPELRAVGMRIYCYALLLEGEWSELLPALQANAAQIGSEEMARYAKTARELGRSTEADSIESLIRSLAPGSPRATNDFA